VSGLNKVIEARLEADRARARLVESVKALEAPLLELKEQLTPRHIMGELFEGAKSKGADLAEDAVDAVRSRPIAATGAVAAIALFLAREPLIDLAGKLIGGKAEKKTGKKPEKKAVPEAKPVAKRSRQPAKRKQTNTEKG
jgi:hypothetical protein